MKILLIGNGKSIHIVRWANELYLQGMKVHLAYCSGDEPLLDKINENIVLHKLIFPTPFGYYSNFFQLKSIIKKEKYDVINAHYASGYGTLGRLATNKKENYVLSVWGSDIYDFPFRSKRNYKLIVKNLAYSKKICSTSNIMAKKINEIIEKKNIYITPFGVDTDYFKPNFNIKNDNEITITIVKSLEEIYGIKYLIEAISLLINDKEVIKKKIKIKLNIVGSGSRENELKDLTKKLKINSNTFFLGYISNTKIVDILNLTDIFALSSINESFGVSALEAMSCSIPVVATDADGFKEVMIDGKTGYIVKKESSVELYEGIKKLVLNKKLRTEMGVNGRNHVLKNYVFKNNVKNMLEIYKK